MYSVPSVNDIYLQDQARRPKFIHYIGWFVFTAVLAFTAVEISTSLSFTVDHDFVGLWGRETWSGIEPELLISLFEQKKIVLISWWIVPGLLVALMQVLVLAANKYIDLKALIFTGLTVLLWGAHAGCYLLIYKFVPLVAEAFHPGVLPCIAWLFSSSMMLLVSAGQWFVLRAGPTALPWILVNGLGYSTGWSVGIYILTTKAIVFRNPCACELHTGI